MTKVFDLFARRTSAAPAGDPLPGFLAGFSLEVMPRTAAKVADFAALLPQGTRVYVAHIDGTPIEDMVATARRLREAGMIPMPHLPARSVPSAAAFAEWLTRYRDEAGVDQALLLAGGRAEPAGPYRDSMQLLETGLLDRTGFTRLHVAGHPEGNRDVDPSGGERVAMDALAWKQATAERTGAEMAIVTQFVFEAAPVLAWARRLEEAGIRLPIHVGVAGPAKLQTLIRYAMTCGVGASVRVLQKRAADVTRLMLPFTPEDVLRDLARAKADNPSLAIEAAHMFPLGGIEKTAEFVAGPLARRRVAAAG